MATLKLSKDDKAKASRKAIPQTTQAWMAEVNGINNFVRAKSALADANGQAWLKSMQRYYRNRLIVLSQNPPKGLAKPAASAIVNEALAKLPTI